MQVTPYSDPTAVVGRRIVAYIVDALIVLVVTVIAFFALAESDVNDIDRETSEKILEAFSVDEDNNTASGWSFTESVAGLIDFDEGTVRIVEGGSFWAVNGVGFGLGLVLLVLMQGATGKTPGKAMLGITTVNAAGQAPGIGRAFVRWLLLFVDSLCLLPGLITSLTTKGHRRIGDMAAGTYVVRSAAAGQPVQVGAAAAPVYAQVGYPQPGFPGVPQATAPPIPQPSADAQWDAARQAWIRWDGAQWTQYDPSVPGGWRSLS